MYGAQQLDDDCVVRAVSGTRSDMERVAQVLLPQMRAMVGARLSAQPGLFHVVEEIAQAAMVAVSDALPRLENQSVDGLKSFVSVIVTRKVADFLREKKRANIGGRPVASLETTVADFSGAGPLWQFLSISGPTPLSAARQADQVSLVMTELGQIKEEYREVITLALFDQLSTKEISHQLGTSRRAVSMLLLRAIRTLRRRVTGSSRPGAPDAGSI